MGNESVPGASGPEPNQEPDQGRGPDEEGATPEIPTRDLNPWTRTRFERDNAGLEFDRLANFCDAVFAIAMTLIAATIAVPSIVEAGDESELLNRLSDTAPGIVMFFVAFWIIGRYWIAHHRFVSTLRAIDNGFISLMLVYLAFVAFLPFPSALMGRFSDNAIALALFSLSMAAVSGMETVLVWKAGRDDLLVVPLSGSDMRWVIEVSIAPVLVFLVAAALAFVNTWLGAAAWFLIIPLEMMLERWRPESFSPDRHARR